MSKAVCGSCHGPADSYGSTWKNSQGQTLVRIKPHWKAGKVKGMPCSARVGVIAQ